jgi:hypothetical protein
MSLPPNSKQIDQVTFNNLNYLTNTYTFELTSANFNMTTGKPLNNITYDNGIDNTFMTVLSQSLKENDNVCNNFVYKYPKVSEVDVLRDIQVTDETTISAVFISEGASMQNMFGYYMYIVDSNGNKILLDNDGASSYYYKPTVIFPHVYSTNASNTLQNNETRLLRGNLPNGNFENIYIGFFLIPHGWYAYNGDKLLDNASILHSTVDFNFRTLNTSSNLLYDKIYSVFIKAVSSIDSSVDLLTVAFEDQINESSNDMDYNDCIVGFKISDVRNIVDYDKYAKVDIDIEDTTPTYNNIIARDEYGEYIYLDSNRFNIQNNRNYVFERHIRFDNITSRDNLYNAYAHINGNYIRKKEKRSSSGVYELYIEHYFRANDIRKGENSDDHEHEGDGSHISKKIYLLESKYTEHDDNEGNNYILSYKDALINAQNDASYNEKYDFYVEFSSTKIISSNDSIDTPKNTDTSEFRVLGNGVMDCKVGQANLPSSSSTIYQIYKNLNRDGKGLVINACMDTHPNTYMIGRKTFLRYITFISDSTQNITVDLGTLKIYQYNGYTLNEITNFSSLTKFNISNISYSSDNNKKLIKIFNNDDGAYYRSITINGATKFYCIRMPHIKNSPTMVYLDNDNVLTWGNSQNTLSGTYYNKHGTYIVNSHTQI